MTHRVKLSRAANMRKPSQARFYDSRSRPFTIEPLDAPWHPGPASLPDPVAFAYTLGLVAQGYRWRRCGPGINVHGLPPGYWYTPRSTPRIQDCAPSPRRGGWGRVFVG